MRVCVAGCEWDGGLGGWAMGGGDWVMAWLVAGVLSRKIQETASWVARPESYYLEKQLCFFLGIHL